jgi:flagellar hook-basal body complex protein FliE
MQLDPLSSNLLHLLNNEPVRVGSDRLGDQSGRFSDILTESFKTAGRTDAIDKASTLELVTGEADDLSGLLIDMQKAELALQLTLQIRNKIMDAYNEVMRMSV